jgi:hypothetical protein
MKFARILALFFSLLALSTVHAESNSVTEYAFIQTGNQGTLKPVPHQQGMYTLTLNKANPYITYFSDRPKRITNVLTLTQFLKLWNKGIDSFAKDAPNAEVSLIENSHGKMIPHNFTVELTSKYYDKKTQALTYKVRFLDSKTPLNKTLKFEYAVLFIDDDCCCVLNC